MKSKLFPEFEGVSAKAWKQKIQVDLKGADYNETLLSKTYEGIDIHPAYHKDNTDPIPTIEGQPEQWHITEAIFIDDPVIANRLIKKAIKGGATSLLLSAKKPFDLDTLFGGLELEGVQIFLSFKFLEVQFFQTLLDALQAKKAKVHARVDLINRLAASGNWFVNNKEDHAQVEALLKSHAESVSVLGVNTALYANAGANAVQQLAYGLCHANEYLNYFKEQLDKIELTFTVGLEANYFMQIAKLRALRWLYASLAKEHGAKEQCTVLGLPSLRNKTLYDYNVNMLRTTTECMSGVLGGADAVCNLPYDVVFHKSNEFGQRISRNQLLVLKNEAYFNTVSNPADGSYFIEDLTTKLAQNALALFKEIEQSGGLVKNLFSGTLQRKIKENAQKQQEDFDKGQLELVGTNVFPNQQEKLKETVELYPFVKKQTRKTLIEPIISKRLSESYEKTRLDNEE